MTLNTVPSFYTTQTSNTTVKGERLFSMSETTLFVFYRQGENTAEWFYNDMNSPKRWRFTGGGGTDSDLYPSEMQFNGPLKSRQQMRNSLNKFFSNLKNEGIVRRYKIRISYKVPSS